MMILLMTCDALPGFADNEAAVDLARRLECAASLDDRQRMSKRAAAAAMP